MCECFLFGRNAREVVLLLLYNVQRGLGEKDEEAVKINRIVVVFMR